MAQQSSISRLILSGDSGHTLFRLMQSDLDRLEKQLYRRYPDREWGTFIVYGWRRTTWGVAISFVEPIFPEAGDLDRTTALTTFRDQYTRRAFQIARQSNGLGIGVIHSHPAGYDTFPSQLDDDMDLYFSREFQSFTRGAPYCSLIFQRSDRRGFLFTGRTYDRGTWMPVSSLIAVSQQQITRHRSQDTQRETVSCDAALDLHETQFERIQTLIGKDSHDRLRNAVIGVIGSSGTGSPAIEVLARAGVGEFVNVDPQKLSPSNLERVHGSIYADLKQSDYPFKVDLMQRMIHDINPNARVTSIVGNILHDNVLDELLRCDLMLGCVDTQHGRVALSDIARHYLIPSIDIGVRMGGQNGVLNEQVVDFTVFSPDLPCAFCGERIDSAELAVELMTDSERERRQVAALEAFVRGDDPDQYWKRQHRQFPTVGYLTTAAGALAAGYAEGWLSGAFSIPHSTFQFDPSKNRFGCVAPPRVRLAACKCSSHVGWGDMARTFRNVALPNHWSRKGILRSRSAL